MVHGSDDFNPQAGIQLAINYSGPDGLNGFQTGSLALQLPLVVCCWH